MVDLDLGTSRWFGEPWPWPDLPAPICEDDRMRIWTPVGVSCIDCEEPILASDSGTRMPYLDENRNVGWAYQHAECCLRSVMCPIDLGLVPDPSGRHEHDFSQRRAEGRLLMQMARDQTEHERGN